jgi:hypothetical protein
MLSSFVRSFVRSADRSTYPDQPPCLARVVRHGFLFRLATTAAPRLPSIPMDFLEPESPPRRTLLTTTSSAGSRVGSKPRLQRTERARSDLPPARAACGYAKRPVRAGHGGPRTADPSPPSEKGRAGRIPDPCCNQLPFLTIQSKAALCRFAAPRFGPDPPRPGGGPARQRPLEPPVPAAGLFLEPLELGRRVP